MEITETRGLRLRVNQYSLCYILFITVINKSIYFSSLTYAIIPECLFDTPLAGFPLHA